MFPETLYSFWELIGHGPASEGDSAAAAADDDEMTMADCYIVWILRKTKIKQEITFLSEQIPN